jgi:hypothetical protein
MEAMRMHTKLYSEILKGRNHFGHPAIYEDNIKIDFKETGCENIALTQDAHQGPVLVRT